MLRNDPLSYCANESRAAVVWLVFSVCVCVFAFLTQSVYSLMHLETDPKSVVMGRLTLS